MKPRHHLLPSATAIMAARRSTCFASPKQFRPASTLKNALNTRQ
jgi:hypothetical protein